MSSTPWRDNPEYGGMSDGAAKRSWEVKLRRAEIKPVEPGSQPIAPLQWLDMWAWDHAPIPEREWAIRDRVPLKQAGLFSGEGGTGKSIIELMKDVAHTAAKG